MASAAPAAPAPSTGAPASAPTPVATPTDAQPQPAPAPARVAKPIPPPQLPGVFPDDDPFPAAPSSESPSRGDNQPTAGPARGPDGRFLAGASPAGTDGEHGREPGPADPAPPPPTPTAKFKFAGEEYDSQEAAEQNVRSLRGQYRPVQSLARQVGGMEHIAPKFVEAAASARGWQAKATALEAELTALRSGAPASTAAPTSTPTPVAADPAVAEHAIDWDLYAEVSKLANERNEPWKAQQWLHEQTQKVVDSRLQRALADKFAPLEAQQHQQAVAGQTEELFSNLATYVNGDGTPAFPELHDEDSAYEVGRMWATLGLPADFALTPQGAIAAIGIYRMARTGSQARTTPTPPQPAAHPPAPPTAPNHDALAAATLSDGRPARQATAADSPSAEAAYIRAALRSVNAPNRATLGFDA